MITTNFVPGSPCWLDLGSPDLDVSAAFYREVFGWEATEAGGGYRLFQLDGRTVAGAGPLTEEGARSAWMLYFATPDADAATRATERAGGTVRAAPEGGMEFGRLAQLSDPQGGQFAVWQADTFPGFEAVDEPGTLCWVELWTPDAKGAKAFYTEIFDWGLQDVPLPGGGGTYTMVTPAGLGEGREHGGVMEMSAQELPATNGRADWHPVFAVADCDAATARVTANGGEVYMGPEDAEGVGRMSVCADPFKAGFVLLTPVEM